MLYLHVEDMLPRPIRIFLKITTIKYLICLPKIKKYRSNNVGCRYDACMHVCSIMSDSLRSYGLWSTRILCPWDFPGKNIGLGFTSFSRRYSWPGDQICISSRSFIGRQILYHCATWEAKCNESCATVLLKHYLNKETVVHIYSGILLSHRKEWTWVHWTEVDKPRTYYTEWSKSEREK